MRPRFAILLVLAACSSSNDAPAPLTADASAVPPKSDAGPAAALTPADGGAPTPDAAAPGPAFTNPVFPTNCPDPGVLADSGMFYLACTGGKFPVKSSTDLVSWTETGQSILPDGKTPWAANGGRDWAPEIHRVGASFVAYFTSVNSGNVLSIGYATAPAPTGPFTPSAAPLVEDPLGVIDATEFEDDDGSRWLFYKIDGNSQGKPTPIFARELAFDGHSFKDGSSPTQIITNDATTWEGGVVEAPWVVKRGGLYYLFYSGNVYDQRYRTGAARASSITGPWEKNGQPLLANNDAWVGPGHGSVVPVLAPDGKTSLDYFVYHAWKNNGDGTNDTTLGRVILVDRIDWVNDWPQIGGGTPTVNAQPAPGDVAR